MQLDSPTINPLEKKACVNTNRTQQSSLTSTEQVYALILNSDGKALVRQVLPSLNASIHWTMLRANLADNQDPVAVARDELFAYGYESPSWIYLGSFTSSEGRVFHFLFARDAQKAPCEQCGKNGVQWVSLRDLRYALLDGRIGQMSDATSVALSMYLMALHHKSETAVTPPKPA